jgi:hypothetical protein
MIRRRMATLSLAACLVQGFVAGVVAMYGDGTAAGLVAFVIVVWVTSMAFVAGRDCAAPPDDPGPLR